MTFALRLAARSLRWFPPALALLVVLGVLLAQPGPALDNAGGAFYPLVAASMWATAALGGLDDAPHRAMLSAWAGSSGRLHLQRVAAAMCVAATFALVAFVPCQLLARPPVRPLGLAARLAASATFLLCAGGLGVALGSVLHPPGVRHLGARVLAGVGAFLAVLLAAPVHVTLKAANEGRVSGLPGLVAVSVGALLVCVPAGAWAAQWRGP